MPNKDQKRALDIAAWETDVFRLSLLQDFANGKEISTAPFVRCVSNWTVFVQEKSCCAEVDAVLKPPTYDTISHLCCTFQIKKRTFLFLMVEGSHPASQS
uniref:Uncharacterized protein n=1 Tax=Sphaerodactylus townsendi TaxID=933632 RepID=A0ACB8EPY7_9SAUR